MFVMCTDDEGLPPSEAKETCSRILFRRFIGSCEEALWIETFWIGIYRRIMKHIPGLISLAEATPDLTNRTMYSE
jgi:hypothetical protein